MFTFRRLSALFVLALLLFASACAPQPKQETADFSRAKAQALVEAIDRPYLELERAAVVTRNTYKALLAEEQALYTEDYDPTLDALLTQDVSDSPVNLFTPLRDQFWPTIFHEGIELTDAKLVQLDGRQETAQLEVTIAYTGDDEKLQHWSRGYTFYPQENGSWLLHSCSGTMTFVGDGFSPDYLPLK